MNNVVKSNLSGKLMNKKYTFTKEKKTLPDGVILRRIKALRDFGSVKKGNLGGWIENEENLSHENDCWVFDEAEVYGNACVFDNAKVYSRAKVYGGANIFDNAKVYGKACVFDNARVYGNANIFDNARVYCEACISGGAWVYDEACVSDGAWVCNEAYVSGKAQVYGFIRVSGNAEICGNAVVKSESDYAVFKNTWSSGRWFTYTASNKMWKVGCFYGTGKELIAKAKKDSKLSGKCYGMIVKAMENIEKAQNGR